MCWTQARAVELLCKCDDIPDDGIELGVLKGLLTAVTSASLHVHGQVRPWLRDDCTPQSHSACACHSRWLTTYQSGTTSSGQRARASGTISR